MFKVLNMAKVEFDLENKSLKNLRKQFQKHGVFYSSTDLALKLKALLPNNGDDATEIYDPTCGGGSLLAVFGDHVKKYGQELDPSQVEFCKNRLTNAEIVAGDTLASSAFADKKFKYIIANPPFSVKWEQLPNDPRFSVAPALAPKGKADYAFILHCLHYLADDGTAVILGPHGPLFRGAAEGEIRKWLVDNNYIDRIESYPAKLFEDTDIPTMAFVLKKKRDTTDIYFADRIQKLGRSVPLSEIQENDYNLNVTRYIFEYEVPKRYDYPKEILEYVDNTLKQLEQSIDMIAMMSDIEIRQSGITLIGDFDAVLEKMIAIIKQRKRLHAKDNRYYYSAEGKGL